MHLVQSFPRRATAPERIVASTVKQSGVVHRLLEVWEHATGSTPERQIMFNGRTGAHLLQLVGQRGQLVGKHAWRLYDDVYIMREAPQLTDFPKVTEADIQEAHRLANTLAPNWTYAELRDLSQVLQPLTYVVIFKAKGAAQWRCMNQSGGRVVAENGPYNLAGRYIRNEVELRIPRVLTLKTAVDKLAERPALAPTQPKAAGPDESKLLGLEACAIQAIHAYRQNGTKGVWIKDYDGYVVRIEPCIEGEDGPTIEAGGLAKRFRPADILQILEQAWADGQPVTVLQLIWRRIGYEANPNSPVVAQARPLLSRALTACFEVLRERQPAWRPAPNDRKMHPINGTRHKSQLIQWEAP